MKRALILAMVGWLALPTAVLAGEFEVPFERHPSHNAIVVEVRVNGRSARLVVDTGAANTVLSPEITGTPPLELKVSRFSDRGPGFHGEAIWGEATLKLGKRTWYEQRVVVMNLQEVRRLYGPKIDGILGQDLLCAFDQVVIDFKSRTLRLTH